MDLYRQVQTTYDQIVLEFAKRNHFSMADNLVALAQELAEHIGQNGRLMGMLTYARNIVRGNLVSMNMRYLGFRNAFFDGAWCCASLLHLPKTEAAYALQEIRRILKPGGMLILSIQEGNSEGWEDGFAPGAIRFFARYQGDEMRNLLFVTHHREKMALVCLHCKVTSISERHLTQRAPWTNTRAEPAGRLGLCAFFGLFSEL